MMGFHVQAASEQRPHKLSYHLQADQGSKEIISCLQKALDACEGLKAQVQPCRPVAISVKLSRCN